MNRKFDRITTHPDILNGQPCLRGTRLTVRRIVEAVALYPDRAELKAEYAYENPEAKPGEVTLPQDWIERVGYPSAFRGYLFNQWPVDQYTNEQKKLLDTLKPYLGLTDGNQP